jgi:hypothetical protein
MGSPATDSVDLAAMGKRSKARRCQGPSQPLVPDEEMPDACSSDAAASTAAPSPSP